MNATVKHLPLATRFTHLTDAELLRTNEIQKMREGSGAVEELALRVEYALGYAARPNFHPSRLKEDA